LGAVDDVAPLGEMGRRVLAHLRTFGERANRV
jgi:two-component system chemotaxis response regulator CheB